MASVQAPPHRDSSPAPRASADDHPCPPHCTLTQSSERAVAPAIARGGIDRRRSGRRSMRTCKGERFSLPFALHSRSKPRACSGTRHRAGWHRSPPLWAEIDGERARASDFPCPSHCTLAQISERAVAPAISRGGIDRRRSGRRSMRTCKRERSPLPAALHSRSKQRACSGTRHLAGWHRSPPLWAEIDGERARASDFPCPPHCTLTQSSERAVAPAISRGGIDRRRSGRRSMANVQARTIATARRTALSLKSASVQWHPARERAVAPDDRLCPSAPLAWRELKPLTRVRPALRGRGGWRR